MPKPIRFGDAETGKESNVYGQMCSELVPFRYLFSAKHTGNRHMIAAFAGHDSLTGQGRGETAPRLRARGRAGAGRLGEYGHLMARDATEGSFRAKKGHFGRAGPRTFLPSDDLGARKALNQ